MMLPDMYYKVTEEREKKKFLLYLFHFWEEQVVATNVEFFLPN